MVVNKWTFDNAFSYVKNIRPLIALNQGFVIYLKRFYHRFVINITKNETLTQDELKLNEIKSTSNNCKKV